MWHGNRWENYYEQLQTWIRTHPWNLPRVKIFWQAEITDARKLTGSAIAQWKISRSVSNVWSSLKVCFESIFVVDKFLRFRFYLIWYEYKRMCQLLVLYGQRYDIKKYQQKPSIFLIRMIKLKMISTYLERITRLKKTYFPGKNQLELIPLCAILRVQCSIV